MTDAQELADELQLILDLDDLAKRAYAVAGKGESRLREASRVFGVNSGAWRGELLGLVREAWACPGVYARESVKGGWVACVRNLDPNGPVFAGPFRAPTEAEALVAALEAAP